MQRVFISYSHKDEGLRAELDAHLALLRREGLMEIWTDHRILAGDEVHPAISQGLEVADIVLLLISPDFNNSDYCVSIELARALERHAAGECVAIPILLRPCDWQTAPYAKFNVIPRNNRPVMEWTSRDAAFAEIVKELRDVIKRKALVGAGSARVSQAGPRDAPPVAAAVDVPPGGSFASLRKRRFTRLAAVVAVAAFVGPVLIIMAPRLSSPVVSRVSDEPANPRPASPAVTPAASSVSTTALEVATLPAARPTESIKADGVPPATVTAAPRSTVATAPKSASRATETSHKVASATWTTSDECLRLTGLLAKGDLEPGDARKLKEACR